MHALIEQGRLGEISRYLISLKQSGAELTECTYFPMLILARRLGDHHMGTAILNMLEISGDRKSERSYSEVIRSLLEFKRTEEAEVVACRAINKGFLPNRKILSMLENEGSFSLGQWEAKWKLAERVRNRGDVKGSPPILRVVVITRGQQESREILLSESYYPGLGGFGLGILCRPQDCSEKAGSDWVKMFTEQLTNLGLRSEEGKIQQLMTDHPTGHARNWIIGHARERNSSTKKRSV